MAMEKLSSSDLLKIATDRTGLSDFGGGEQFKDDFNRFVSALDVNRIPPDRVERGYGYIIELLLNRLWFEKDVRENPEIEDEVLLPPIAVVSLPRAGTTKLQRILGETQSTQNLHYWHTYGFARIPGEPEGGRALRIAKATEFLAWLRSVIPNIMQTHPMAAEEVEEEYLMNEAALRSSQLATIFPVPEYGAWLSKADMSPTYDYLLRQLKYMQWQFKLDGQAPKPWLLKSPGMLGYEDQLARIFPQGLKIISSHRSPFDIIASTARTADLNMQWFGTKVDSRHIGPAMLEWFGTGMSRYLNWRKANTSVDVLDIGFGQITNDSIGTARSVCDFIGVPLSREAEARIARWDQRNPRDKHGRNDASLAEYGTDVESVNKVFAGYISQFSGYF